MPTSNTCYDCHVHSIRRRLGDVDGISAKAALDAIVREEGTVLGDDSAKWVKSIKFTQETGRDEITYITFTPVEEAE